MPKVAAGQPPLIDANGDGNGQYSIFQLDGKGMYRRVGGWMDRGLVELDVDDIRHGLRVCHAQDFSL